MGQQLARINKKIPFKPIKEVQKSNPTSYTDFRWSLWDGEDTTDPKKLVSIFSLEPSTNEIAIKMFKRFKTIRHPNILPFIHGVEEDSKFYIVTERVYPLITCISDFSTFPDSISWGIYQVFVFLNYLS